MKNTEAKSRNLPPGWTGTLVELDLRTISTLPCDSYFDGVLQINHPESKFLLGLRACLSRGGTGEWCSWVVQGYADNGSGRWQWQDAGDPVSANEPPIIDLINELRLSAERLAEQHSYYPWVVPEEFSESVLETLVQHLEEAADHLKEAYQRATSAT